MQRLVVGNWKMYGSLPQNRELLQAVRNTASGLSMARCAVCVPFPYLDQARTALAGSPAAWGAQNVSQHAQGAYTGEVSAEMLKEFGCRYVIVGHSERRALFGEDDQTIALKAQAAIRAGMTPVVCIGETLPERDAGATESVVARQLDAILERLGAQGVASIVLAYEPVWAIGTGKTATPEQAQSVHAFVRRRVAAKCGPVQPPILYGGSVKSGNAAGLFAMPDIDGGLIGSASLDGQEFDAICRAADRRARD